MFARMTTIKGEPDNIDTGIQQFRERTAHSHELEGFKGFYLLVERKSGKMVAITLWETEAAMQASSAPRLLISPLYLSPPQSRFMKLPCSVKIRPRSNIPLTNAVSVTSPGSTSVYDRAAWPYPSGMSSNGQESPQVSSSGQATSWRWLWREWG